MTPSDRPLRAVGLSRSEPMPAGEALRRLRDGNRRFAQNVRSVDTMLSQAARNALVAAQAPIAIVLSCSDARVPAELVFDQGLGTCRVRVAGNVVAPTLVGSIEGAVAAFGTALVIVMGHTHRGALAATLDWMTERGAPPSGAVHEILARISRRSRRQGSRPRPRGDPRRGHARQRARLGSGSSARAGSWSRWSRAATSSSSAPSTRSRRAPWISSTTSR